MVRQLKMAASILVAGAALAAGLPLLHGCSGDPEKRLVAEIPDADRTLVHHLVASDDSTLIRYARTAGVYPVRHAGTEIVSRLHTRSEQQFARSRDALLPALERIAAVYERAFDSRRFAWESEFWTAATAGVAAELAALRDRRTAALRDTTVTTAQRIAALERIRDGYREVGYRPGAAICAHETGNLLARSDKERQQLYYRRALADARSVGMHPMVCQILGTLGHEAAVAGRTDSMFYYWDRSRRVAEAHGLPDYSARIYEFYARHYETEGRLALAHDLLLKAQEVCRNLKGGYRELRFVVKLIDFYNDLECWNVSARLLPRAELLEQKVPDTNPTGAYAHVLRSRMARARFLMATGRVDEAEAILAGVKPLAGRQPQRDQLPRLLFAWSEDLMDGGYDDRARDLVDEGLALSKQVNFPYLIPKFHLLRAELRLRAGDPDGALAAVADFERTTAGWPAKYESEWITRDVLVTRVLRARGEADSAATTLVSGLARLNRSLAAREPSTHGYLWLDHNDGLRRELRRWTRSDPTAAYGAELYWRGLYARMGRGSALAEDPETAAGFYGELRRLASRAITGLSRDSATHLLFVAGDDGFVRFAAGPRGVRRARLAVSVGELERITTETWQRLSAEQTNRRAPVTPELARLLRALALQLLPPDVLEARRPEAPRTLYVSAGGFLAALPFETLNLASDGSFTPLAAHRDVVYLRGLDPETRGGGRPGSGGLLVSNPTLSPEVRRRLAVPRPLPGASREIAAVAARLDAPTVLDGDAATKAALTSAWEEAPLLYIAAHFLSHPEIPFLTLLPLADPGTSAAPGDAFIDIGDVRAADLGACDLAVLSGCATGAPYVSTRVTGPSFGDAVVDAGARQVIQTFWDVRDDYAQERVTEFFRSWREGRASAAAALNAVRRLEINDPDGPVHPHFWAAFHVKVGHL